MRMMKERELCSAGGCRRSFDKTIVQIVVYEAVFDHVHVEVVLFRHGMATHAARQQPEDPESNKGS